ncbi:MAG TPA: hypothetical protein PLI53_00190 [Geobacteraceae bacterium]|nr:hypothetical protein [Geobacteraceae bacterium]
MAHRVKKLNRIIFLFLMIMLVNLRLPWALDPRFDLDLKDLRMKKGRQLRKAVPEVKKRAAATSSTRREKESRVRKKAGRGKVLKKDKKLSRDMQRRKRGQGGKAAVSKRPAAARGAERHFAGSKEAGVVHQRLRLSAPAYDRSDVVRWARTVWKRFFASGKERQDPFRVAGKNFALSLDPALYPVLPAMDGGKIIIDADASLSPFVRTILEEQEPDARIVTADPADPKKFFAVLLDAGRFYSVVENFSIGFGADPRLTVSADFKIEKTPDSLLENDVLLLNLVGRRIAFPAPLVSYLEREGFRVVDASPVPSLPAPRRHHVVYSVVDGNQLAIVDALMEAISVPCEKNRRIPLDDGISKGVVLSVNAERYFENNASKVVVISYEKTPLQDALLKILRDNGYQVVALHPEDDFREIADKVLSVLKLPASYDFHHLWNSRDVSFDVRLSGFAVPAGDLGSGRIFLTNAVLSPFFKELVATQGYAVIEK